MLVEILKSVPDKNLLEEMENFHSRFIKEEDRISSLRNDFAELDKLLTREVFEGGKIVDEITRKIYKLRNNINIVGLQFCHMKFEFNNYVSEMFNNRDRKEYFLTAD